MAAAITAEDVAQWQGSQATETLEVIVDPIVSMIESWKGKPQADWPPQWRLGAIMLIARVDRRRMSPSGVETISEMGPVYVSRRDPEVAQLLELGEWKKPVVL